MVAYSRTPRGEADDASERGASPTGARGPQRWGHGGCGRVLRRRLRLALPRPEPPCRGLPELPGVPGEARSTHGRGWSDHARTPRRPRQRRPRRAAPQRHGERARQLLLVAGRDRHAHARRQDLRGLDSHRRPVRAGRVPQLARRVLVSATSSPASDSFLSPCELFLSSRRESCRAPGHASPSAGPASWPSYPRLSLLVSTGTGGTPESPPRVDISHSPASLSLGLTSARKEHYLMATRLASACCGGSEGKPR